MLSIAIFVVWCPTDIHIERITANKKFIAGPIEGASDVFKNEVLPELLARWYSRDQQPHTTSRVYAQSCIGINN